MAQTAVYHATEIGPGVRAFILPTQRLRRTHVMAFLHLPLAAETVSAAGLLPEVLRRGTERYPTGLDLARALAERYGASLHGAVSKIGDRQVLSFSLNVPADAHVPEPVFSDSLELLREVIFTPAHEGEAFRRDYVEQEKALQIGRIRALINQKIQYAVTRCLAEAFAGEPYGLYSLGSEEGVASQTPESLFAFHRRLLRESPLDLYVVGDVDPDATREQLTRAFRLDRTPPSPLQPTQVSAGEGEPRRIIQEEPMEQAWLVLCLRSDVAYGDPDRWALTMFNGLLGGTTQSKLFLNVRERASLAYAAASQYDANKGVVLALAGIAPENFEKALQLMHEQIDALRRGDITPDEWEGTRRSLITRLRQAQDDPGSQVMHHLRAEVEGVAVESVDEAIARLEALQPRHVAEAAERLRLDTVYLLRGRKNGQPPAS